MPGDSLIPDAIASLTHAITIRCRAQDVWPWLAQMGAGSRAGWYSYDFLDNGRQPSARHVRDDLQHLTYGTLMPALPGVTDGFTVLAYERNRFLAIGWRDRERVLMTWTFVLEERSNRATRLTVRARGGPQYHFHHWPWWLAKRVIPTVHFIMQRKQLLGIARRAESIDRGVPCHAPSLSLPQ
jgi:hypothetical protein